MISQSDQRLRSRRHAGEKLKGDMARFQEELAKAGALLDGSGCTQLEGLAGALLTQLQSGGTAHRKYGA
jgi:hypothetical protein